jgi:hypothetical protein
MFEKAKDKELFRLLTLVWDYKMMKKTLKGFNLDLSKLPLGLL